MATPKLRFKEFTEEWSIAPLSNIALFSKGALLSKADLSSNGTSCILYGELYTTYNEVIYDVKSKTEVDISLLKFSKVNDVIIPSSGETAVDIATASCIMTENIACGGDLNIISPYNDNGIFISYQLNNSKRNCIAKIAQGASVVHIYNEGLKKIKINLPTLAEQKKIADFLSLLDRKIALQEKKIALLKDYKKGLFENTIQEKNIGIWNTLKLSDVLIERKEYSIKGSNYIHCSLTQQGVVDKTERYERDFLVRDEEKNYKITKLNDICYNPANLKFGVICRNTYGEAIFSPIYVTFEVKKKYSPTYIGYYLSRWNFINAVRKYEEGTVYERMAVKPTDLLNFEVSLPNIETQLKIADVLKKTDSKEVLNVVKLNRIKSLKQALLQQMFI